MGAVTSTEIEVPPGRFPAVCAAGLDGVVLTVGRASRPSQRNPSDAPSVTLPRDTSPVRTKIEPACCQQRETRMGETSSWDRTVLIVDGDRRFRHEAAQALDRAGWTVVEAASGEEALSIASRTEISLAIVEVRLIDISGY